jgi:tRNA threonylcarbamoyladenosine biosynthesis protein TsaB
LLILSIDTTTRWGSVALLDGPTLRNEIRFHHETHSRTVFPAIESLLRLAGRAPTEVEAYVVATGPGSFTGVRVGIGAAQGLSLASGRPCLGLSSLVGLAAKIEGAAPTLVPVVDAYREGQVFAAVYEPDLRERRPPAGFRIDELLASLSGPAAFLGDGASRYREAIRTARPDAVLPERSLYLAGALGRVGAARLAAGEGGAAAELRPTYLRAPDIWPQRPAPVSS